MGLRDDNDGETGPSGEGGPRVSKRQVDCDDLISRDYDPNVKSPFTINNNIYMVGVKLLCVCLTANRTQQRKG